MSNSRMRGMAAGDWSIDDDCAEIQRKRDALRSKLAVLEEARRRLEEIQHDADGQQLVHGAAAAEFSDDDFYLLDDYDDEPPEERPAMQWQDQVCRQMVYNARRRRRRLQQDDDDIDHDHDIDLNDDSGGRDAISRDIVTLGLHVPHIHQQSGTGTATPPPPTFVVPGAGGEEEAAHRRGGFGAVPASAAAIAGLEKHRYDGSSSSSGGGGDSMCVICMREYKKGRRLRVMPCAHKHRFHGKCIREWLSRSNLCPLCRHALPTAATTDAERREGGGRGVHRRVLVRVNVNPY